MKQGTTWIHSLPYTAAGNPRQPASFVHLTNISSKPDSCMETARVKVADKSVRVMRLILGDVIVPDGGLLNSRGIEM